MVLAARIMQVIGLFSSFAVILTDIGLISVTRNAAENKADNAINYQKTIRETTCFGRVAYTRPIDQIIMTS